MLRVECHREALFSTGHFNDLTQIKPHNALCFLFLGSPLPHAVA